MMISTANICLNRESFLLKICNLLIIVLQKIATNKTATHNQKAYKKILTVPARKESGKIVAMINEYVGEHVLKIGHRDAHNKICPRIPSFFDFTTHVHDICNRFFICSQIFGNSDSNQYPIRIIPDKIFQTDWSTDIKAVETFNRKVKRTIDTTNDKIIIIIFL